MRAMIATNLPDVPTFEAWLRLQPGWQDAAVADLEPVTGGASNITCRVELRNAPVPAVALRLQRDRGIFEPYDVLREGAVLRSLERSLIPAPRVLAEERSRQPLGAPFIVLEWIDAPHMGEAGPDADFGAFVQMVVAIHNVDWQELGFDAAVGVPANAAASTLAEVEAIAARMTASGCESEPLFQRSLARLREALPQDGELRLCQGDINVFNYLFRSGEVVGVVDWEQARIGDCRSDVAQLVALSHLKGAQFGPAQSQPFVLAYQSAAGRPLTQMAYFRVLWAFQLAVIYHGWVAFNGDEPWFSRADVYGLLEASLAEL